MIVDITVGQWVLVQYENFEYPGEVLQNNEDEAEVSVMLPAGTHWKWPEPRDILYYKKENIVKVISKPSPVNNRGHFSFV